ncbi:dUTP diphosphatase [Methylobacillus sp.]|uniref:dUTP diphosphatase n=1 Tax=Methylobacillus sp. TaxID=56818 RepID=UPI0012C3C6A9|nr:dUTP diphosphatase [Methylobacillus sp.]MPS48493.1 dUTP diphosphatase [Methylobacillus sp.]
MNIIYTNKQIQLKHSTEGSAGYDVQHAGDETIKLFPGNHVTVDLGFKVHIADPNIAAIVIPRSGLGTKHGLVLRNLVGLIDSDYQGGLKATLVNTGRDIVTIKPLDRIGQIMFVPVIHPEFNEVESFDEVTERGEGGHGSTGVSA